MYFFSFLRACFRKHNLLINIYILINMAIMFFGFTYLLGGNLQTGWVYGLGALGAYFVGLFFTFTPIGEWLMRRRNNCKAIEGFEGADGVKACFDEVVNSAINAGKKFPKNIKLYVNPLDNSVNAFATGRKTICITAGTLMEYNNPEFDDRDSFMKAILAHELGHLANNDTYMLQCVQVGNIIVSVLIFIYSLIVTLIGIVIGFISEGLSGFFIKIFGTLVISAVNYIWSLIGVAFVNFSGRRAEYFADSFAKDIGYGYELAVFLGCLKDFYGDEKPMGIMAMLASTHPQLENRINKLNATA